MAVYHLGFEGEIRKYVVCHRSIRHRLYIGLMLVSLAMALGLGPMRPRTAAAQGIISPRQAAEQIYAEIPDLPLENHYERADTGEVDGFDTLMSRFIRYHLFVQRRQPIYRLDWKLTFADYLGVNEWVTESVYPSSVDLETSPRNGDMNAIRSLNLAQRQALVDALVAIYRPS